MKEEVEKPDKCSCHKFVVVLIFLTIFAIILLSYYMEKDQKVALPPLNSLGQNNVYTTPVWDLTTTSKGDNFCRFPPVSPEDAVEERLLLASNAWPTPSLLTNFSLSKTSNPRGSNFVILTKDGDPQWHVGDQLKVLIQINDFQGNPKKTGGDFILARLHNPVLHAGVTGQVTDHLNGSYSAEFPLLWEGRAEVEVTLVHPSEAITVLSRLTKEHPDRVQFVSIFRSGKVSEQTVCNVCLRPTKEPICNFTDSKTGEPWFCYKPKKLDCDTRVIHSRTNFIVNFGPYATLFQSKVNMNVFISPSGASSVNVLQKVKGTASGSKFNQSGYYFNGLWQSLTSTPVHHFDTTAAISQCLQNKMLYMYGDSTVRQWYEYLIGRLPDLMHFNMNSLKLIGPFMGIDYKRKTMVRFRVHGPPLRFTPLPVAELHYVANELDTLVGGKNTVVVFGVWAHFGTFPTEIYIRRLLSIRKAVVRLLKRAPDTLVVIRTANLRHLTPAIAWTNSDFYSMERDKILRAVFKDVNVRWVDAWEMTVSHYLPHDIHPPVPIIKNMIDVLLSFICPGMGS
ncbi:NXPE family member 3-like [Synchiropus picturatus]